ncbi:MAG: TraR/DksA C4-type zinc finger protein [Candidatus Krumholzibacteriaceae bacterium]|jgi:RNA polymerase-binding protein DksA
MAQKKTIKKAVKKAVKKVQKKTVKKAAKKIEKKAEKKIEKKVEKKVEAKKRKLSKQELAHYRGRLLAERDRILRELGRITEAINESAEEQEAAKQSYSNHLADLGTDYMEKEKNYYYADQEGQYLKSIEAALERLDRGEYGLCIECGDLISEKRLEAVPAAELCIKCKDKKEKLERGH